MDDILLDAELLEEKHTTDTEENLLLDTVLPVAAIEGVSDRTVELRVHVVIRIEEIELYTTYVNCPYECMNGIVVIRNVDYYLVAVLVKLALDRKGCELLSLVVGNLLSVHRESLSEVAEAIEETNGTEVHVRVRCLLDVVTSEDSKTTRVNLEDVAKTVLHTEVSHGWTVLVRLNIHVCTELSVELVYTVEDRLILSESLKFLIIHTREEKHRIVVNLLIESRVDVAIELLSLFSP